MTLSALLLIPAIGFAEQYRVGIPVSKNNQHTQPNSTIFPTLLDNIGKLSGDTFVYIYLPASRVKKYFNEGKIDIEPAANPVWRKNEAVPGLYSIAYSQHISIILFNKNKQNHCCPA